MSDTRSPGWDRAEVETSAPALCDYHEIVTERLSSFHASQIARQCPWCVAARFVVQDATAKSAA